MKILKSIWRYIKIMEMKIREFFYTESYVTRPSLYFDIVDLDRELGKKEIKIIMFAVTIIWRKYFHEDAKFNIRLIEEKGNNNPIAFYNFGKDKDGKDKDELVFDLGKIKNDYRNEGNIKFHEISTLYGILPFVVYLFAIAAHEAMHKVQQKKGTHNLAYQKKYLPHEKRPSEKEANKHALMATAAFFPFLKFLPYRDLKKNKLFFITGGRYNQVIKTIKQDRGEIEKSIEKAIQASAK